jgi:hypothetical protein
MKPNTIGFSIHRSEVIGITADLMHRHDVIFLEEPPANGLQEMLQGTLSIDDYLLPAEVEYLEFSRRIKTEHARQLVDDYLVRIKKLPRQSRKPQPFNWQTEGEYI